MPLIDDRKCGGNVYFEEGMSFDAGYHIGGPPIAHAKPQAGARVTLVQQTEGVTTVWKGHLRSANSDLYGGMDIRISADDSAVHTDASVFRDAESYVQALERASGDVQKFVESHQKKANRKESTVKFSATYVREPRTGMITVYMEDKDGNYIGTDGKTQPRKPGEEPIVFGSMPEEYFDAMTKAQQR